VGWSRDAPAQKRRYDPVATNWMGDDEKGTTSLAVKVTDEQGVALPGVIVEIQSLSQQATKRSGVTDPGGLVRFGELPAGRFSVKAALSDFNSRTNTITASAGAGLFLPMTLGISSVSEVTVTAESPVVDMRKSSIGETQFQIPRQRGGKRDKNANQPKSEPMLAPVPAQLAEMDAGVEEAVEGGVEGGVAGGVVGGVAGGAPGGVMGATGFDNSFVIDGVSLQQNQAGVRSLPMDVTGHGKRLTLSGPLVGSGALSVTLKVKRA
jgi:Carboxypeptidase regulatory-like domain